MEERWHDILGFEGIYQGSSLGRLKRIAEGLSTWPGRILKGSVGNHGYIQVALTKNGVQTQHLLHRIIYEAFHSLIAPGYDVHHKDENKINNRIENLEVKLRSIHTAQHHNSTFTDSIVFEMRRSWSAGEKTIKQLVSEYGGSRRGVFAIVTGERWKHVKVFPPPITNGRTRLTANDVREIRRLYDTGNYSYRELGKMFGVSPRTAGCARNFKTWKNID